MKKSNNIIYKITNRINGKVYVGLTTQGLASRKSEHKYRLLRNKRDHKIYSAFRKYGFENFKFESICSVFDENDLPEFEIKFIDEFDSFRNGYNMNKGGDMVSEETRKKLSKVFKGRKITWYDKILKSRFSNPNRKDPKNYVAKGKDNVKAKEYIIQFPNGYVAFVKGLRQFCKDKGLTHSNLFATANGGQNYHRGYRILARFNDQPKGVHSSEWKRAASFLKDDDMVWPAWKHAAASNRSGIGNSEPI